MAKGSGSTRTQRPASNEAVSSPGLSMSQFEAVVNAIANKGDIDWRTWEDMDLSQKELALMESGFSGLTNDDDLENGTIYYAEDRKRLMDYFYDELDNEIEGYGKEDSSAYVFGYKDGSRKYLDNVTNDFADLKLTRNQSGSTQRAIIDSAMKYRDLQFIIRSDGYEQPRYWVKNDAGLAALKEYGGWELWKKGRGEKRRDYIQDDWI